MPAKNIGNIGRVWIASINREEGRSQAIWCLSKVPICIIRFLHPFFSKTENFALIEALAERVQFLPVSKADYSVSALLPSNYKNIFRSSEIRKVVFMPHERLNRKKQALYYHKRMESGRQLEWNENRRKGGDGVEETNDSTLDSDGFFVFCPHGNMGPCKREGKGLQFPFRLEQGGKERLGNGCSRRTRGKGQSRGSCRLNPGGEG